MLTVSSLCGKCLNTSISGTYSDSWFQGFWCIIVGRKGVCGTAHHLVIRKQRGGRSVLTGFPLYHQMRVHSLWNDTIHTKSMSPPLVVSGMPLINILTCALH